MADNENIPFQVSHLIENMMNKKESVHIRGNYRLRLEAIRKAVDTAVKKYDDEMMLGNISNKRK